MLLFRTIFTFLGDREYRDLLLTTVIIIGLGTVVYHYVEGWSWIDSVYFSVITLTTIGYGDFYPTTDGGKLFTIIYILLGIGIILSFINAVYIHYNTVRSEKKPGASPPS
ncbi:MAG: two pore domain potassium channel family protein [Bacteroidia bacterium]|nr:two pore domain potassium channel family protein [Bacteroidia bacterium]